MFKVIYANGDSYTAGDELASATFTPHFSTLYSRSDKMKQSDKENFYKFDKLRPNLKVDNKAYTAANKEMCYVKTLGSALGLPVINESLGGRSNQTVATTTIQHFNSDILMMHRPEDVLAVIGLTSFERIKLPNPTNDKFNHSLSMLLSFPTPTYSKEVSHFFTSHATDEYLFFDNYLDIMGLVAFFEKMNISYIFADSGMYTKRMSSVSEVAPASKNLMPKPDAVMSDEILDHYEKVYHSMGHFSKVIHDRFAITLEKIIREKFSDKL